MKRAEDELLLDAIERLVMDRDVVVELERCWVNAGLPSAWQVSFKLNAKGGSGKNLIAMASGGGVTLREALSRAFCMVAEQRLSGGRS